MFNKIPKSMQLVAAAVCGIIVLAVTALIDRQAFMIAALGIGLVVGAIFAWQFYSNLRGRQRAKAMTGQITAHSTGRPAGLNDPAHIATLDRLRENFSRGIEKFEAVGKDLYSLPWYVVCGEPGSGKTEAVRRCKVGFPPGLQDEMQGAGGTINMHWWFTNHAVLIDTAGKLLFQETPAGTTSEWTEFLNLLRTSRPHCPINGLLLVIPSESLIKDSFEEIENKAGKIARQLNTIQRTLDVRFPVFVLITKCDKIVGFREFFSGIKNQQLQDQMTGWSNPAPLDTPVQLESISQHLAEVVKRIGRRQLGMLKDPVATDAGKRRIDEVDSLYSLSASVGALAPRLRKYLETIFVVGGQQAKPLFLRGIYFTSALTEGKELDTELAAALGMSEDQLPASKAWERERSYFLKDLFLQKIFREKGLVTRASNTDQLVKTRQRMIGGVVVAGLVSVLAVSIFGYMALKSSVGAELVFWRAGAKAENWTGPTRWKPIVNSQLEYTGNDIVQMDKNKSALPIVEFHEQLQQRVSTDMQIPWIYKPIEAIALSANSSRRQAQRILYEASVIAPTVEASRNRLINSTDWTAADTERLGALLQLEGAIHLKDMSGYDPEYPAEDFFKPLLGPSMASVPAGKADLDTLMKIYEWTYFRGGAGRGQWPGTWLTRGKNLRDNQPLIRGWDSLERSVQNELTAQRETVQAIKAGRLVILRFADSEKAFLRALSQPRANMSVWKKEVGLAWDDLASRRAALDKLVTDLKTKTGVSDALTLEGAYQATADRMKGESERAAQLIRAALLKQKLAADEAAKATSGPASEFSLYRDLERRVTALNTQVTTQLEQVMPAAEEALLADADVVALNAANEGLSAYAVRCDAYSLGMDLVVPQPGTKPKPASVATLRDRANKYVGHLRSDFRNALNVFIEAAAAAGVK
ncbi:MAG TPA: type VI secretion protein IcmF/TssM N-terminal domain-containing protein [Lacunisphaera sp.]|nr:type VI secretion protein IcmF/TssM N-terminal domain-containing protein [Lacunisphaera sp.]